MPDKITQIYVGQRLVGLAGLEEIFQDLARSPLEAPGALQEELLRRVAARNYLPPGSRPAYRQALWREFRRYRGEEVEPEASPGLNIQVLGLGCTGCQIFYRQVLDILTRRRMEAGVEYITDPTRLKEYSIRTLPALLINGEVALWGRIPQPAELEKLLLEAEKKQVSGSRG